MNRYSPPASLPSGNIILTPDEWREVLTLMERLSKIAEKASQRRPSVDREALTERARQAFIDRRKRIATFGTAMFGEPAWDMLLILYCERDMQKQTIGRLSNFAGAALSTALRWLAVLEKSGMVRREDHPTDTRAVFVSLTDKGEKAFDSYFSETLTPTRWTSI